MVNGLAASAVPQTTANSIATIRAADMGSVGTAPLLLLGSVELLLGSIAYYIVRDGAFWFRQSNHEQESFCSRQLQYYNLSSDYRI